MSRDLPFAIRFALPDGWALAPPDASGQPDAAFVAVRQANAGDTVATNIVINGFVSEGVDILALADDYSTRLQEKYSVTILKRDILTTSESSPEAAQLLQVEYPVAGTTVVLRQIQIINAFPDLNGIGVAVLQLLMTCPADVFDQAGPEFQQFVATIATGP